MTVLSEAPHRRFNPLTGEWVLVSPHRLRRPWQGRVETLPDEARPAYDPACYLCPGNARAGDAVNPHYESTFVFDNDFAALLPESHGRCSREGTLFLARLERGMCRVVCFSPRHDLTLAEMSHDEIARVVDVWVEQWLDLGAHDFIRYVQIFENKGALMGCSNPHPHGQIWATESLPVEPEKEHRCQREYFHRHHRTMLEDYMSAELERAERIVCRNATWAAVVPFWAKWPFETLLAPLRPVQSIAALDEAERDGLADILRRMTVRYDNLFHVSFPYTMGLHQAPTDGLDHPHWHLHLHFYPPLLRSASVQKFMVGFEMLATPQRDFTPEDAAEQLRDLSEVHYRCGAAPAAEAGA